LVSRASSKFRIHTAAAALHIELNNELTTLISKLLHWSLHARWHIFMGERSYAPGPDLFVKNY